MCVPSGKFAGVARVNSPKGKFEAVTVPLRCKKWHCEDCGPFKFKQLFARFMCGKIANPVPGFRPQFSHKLLTLTCPGEAYRKNHSPEEALAHMGYCCNKMMRAIRKKRGKFDYARIVEHHKDGYPHFHLILRGGVVAPKDILLEIRHYWCDLYGMGNVDIQKNKSKNPKGMIKYVLKYLKKNPPILPKGKRLYITSRGAIEPIKKRAPRDWVFYKIFAANKCFYLPEEYESQVLSSPYDVMRGHDPDLKGLAFEYFQRFASRGFQATV